MKKIFYFLCLLVSYQMGFSQVTYSVDSARLTAANTVVFYLNIQSNVAGTKLGDGMVYVEYDENAFGGFVVNENKISLIKTNFLLGTKAGATDVYSLNGVNLSGFNDNTASRFVISWELADVLNAVAIPTTPTRFAKFEIQVANPQNAKNTTLCLSSTLMDNETKNSSGAKLGVTTGTCEAILPVKLISFTGVALQNKNLLEWQTEREQSMSHYEVEKSSDGIEFEHLKDLKAKGSLTTTTDYTYSDELPLFGLNYYRLKMVDLDGKFSYSPTINLEHQKPSVEIYPNPMTNVLSISQQLPSGSYYKVEISDAMGKLVGSYDLEAIEGEQSKNIDVSHLSAGYYNIKVIVNEPVNGTFMYRVSKI